MKEAKTQAEFEELSKLGDWFYVTSGRWTAWEQAHVVAREQAHVVARGQAHVEAWGQAHVEAREQAHVEARGQAHVVATSPYVSILAKSKDALLSGGYILGNKPLSALEWLCACGVKVTRGKAVLFKSLNKDWSTKNGVSFKVGKVTAAPDWDASFGGECGKGLHFSPTVAQTKPFRNEGVFIACQVAVKDMAQLPAFAEYPDKIRARACKVLYLVNEDGKRLGAVKRDKLGRFIK